MNPVVLAYELYGLIIAVGLACLVLGVTAMRLANESGGRDPDHFAHMDAFSIAAGVIAVIGIGFRIRSYVSRLVRAAQAH